MVEGKEEATEASTRNCHPHCYSRINAAGDFCLLHVTMRLANLRSLVCSFPSTVPGRREGLLVAYLITQNLDFLVVLSKISADLWLFERVRFSRYTYYVRLTRN